MSLTHLFFRGAKSLRMTLCTIIAKSFLLLISVAAPAMALEDSGQVAEGSLETQAQAVTEAEPVNLPEILTTFGQKKWVLEARVRSVAAVGDAADEASEKRTIIDFQRIVLPIDRVDGGSYTNQTPFVTWVKGERSDQVYPVPPGVTYPWAIDGFADPIHRPGHVYKVIDGLHMYYELVEGKPVIDFTADGGLRFVPGYAVAQSLKGGWRDESWHEEIRSQTDHGWDNLFEVSRLNLSPVL